jgi:hypothetical protein
MPSSPKPPCWFRTETSLGRDREPEVELLQRPVSPVLLVEDAQAPYAVERVVLPEVSAVFPFVEKPTPEFEMAVRLRDVR